MFNFPTTLDKPAYDEGETVTLTVGPPAVRIVQVFYARHEQLSGTSPTPTFAPVAFAIDGLAATGTARRGLGHLFVQVEDEKGRDAATYVRVDVAGPLDASTPTGHSLRGLPSQRLTIDPDQAP